MTEQWSVPAWAAVTALVALVLLVLVAAAALVARARARRSSREELDGARVATEDLRLRLEEVERRLVERERAALPEDTEFVITRVGAEQAADGSGETRPVPAVPAPVFADIVLREGVVSALTLAAGVRRALSPEVRHRIRFEMRREVKRARKQRRADLRTARREWEARQRAGLDRGEGPSEAEPAA